MSRHAMPRHPSLSDLGRAEHGGFRGVTIAGVACRTIHRNRRGNISILFLFYAIVFYVLACMIWNTGVVTSAKIEAQIAADTSAYSSAVWTSRATNMMVATNMGILKSWSALPAAAVVDLPANFIPVTWIIYCIIQSIPCGPGFPGCFFQCIGQTLAQELDDYLKFLFGDPTTWPTQDPDYGAYQAVGTYLPIPPTERWRAPQEKMRELYAYQQQWISPGTGAPKAIELQRQAFQEYYDCDIYLARPDRPDGIVIPPVVSGSANPASLSVAIPFYLLRMVFEVLLNEDGQLMSDEFRNIRRGFAYVWWLAGFFPNHIRNMIDIAAFRRFHVLATQTIWLEKQFWWDDLQANYGDDPQAAWWPYYLSQQAPYTVVAVARPRTAKPLMAPGIFTRPITPVAYAQAETFNGIYWHLQRDELNLLFRLFFPGGLGLRLIPWQAWTTWGWHWEPRLTRGDLIGTAITNNAALRGGFFAPVGATVQSDVDKISHH